MASDVSLDREINDRISAAASAFGKLRKRVFDNHELALDTKIRVYQAVIIPTLLYGSETWITYRYQVKQLEKFHRQRYLRSIMNIKWYDRVTNAAVLDRASLTSIDAILQQHRLRWYGHNTSQNSFSSVSYLLDLEELVLLKRDTRTHLKGPLKTVRLLTGPQPQQTDWCGGERFVMALRRLKPIGE